MSTATPQHIPVRPDWLVLRPEPVLDPEREIVDSHHHLWDRPGYRYLLPELLEDLAEGHRVVQTVFMQCRSMYRAGGPEALRPVGEVEFANGGWCVYAPSRVDFSEYCQGTGCGRPHIS